MYFTMDPRTAVDQYHDRLNLYRDLHDFETGLKSLDERMQDQSDTCVQAERSAANLKKDISILEEHVKELERYTLVLEKHVKKLEDYSSLLGRHVKALEEKAYSSELKDPGEDP